MNKNEFLERKNSYGSIIQQQSSSIQNNDNSNIVK